MTHPPKTQIHATTVELGGIALILRGAPGSGKSDLALRLIDDGARLVADDRTDLVLDNGELMASCPATIAGRLEVRGIGIVNTAWVKRARVGLAVDLVGPEKVERLPPPARCSYLGVEVPVIALAPFECSARVKLRMAARQVAADGSIAA